jgi:site-specific DNA-methyltransferase (adenine-specific)
MSIPAAVPDPSEPRSSTRRPTATATFGSSRRESHDATAFYQRFTSPRVTTDGQVQTPSELDVIVKADARDMRRVESNSVALVVTSPPYFAGKEYEEELGKNGVPATYIEYLKLLADVFAECKRVLEPGGRIAVNVANLGRRPYRSLSGDVTQILQDLGLLMRGEVIWWKGKAAGGSCAWGTFQRPGNPVLRDVTERIVIASKERFDRAISPPERHDAGWPSVTTISRDEFLEATTDLWEIPPESASRVNHPAPFPVELPKRLIELYTYEEDLILDPFMGSGTTAVAAIRTQRHYVGFDTDSKYVKIAKGRVKAERELARADEANGVAPLRVALPAVPAPADSDEDFQARAVREGRKAKELARIVLETCGFTDVRADVRLPHYGVEVNFVAQDATGCEWAFDVSGAFTSSRAGLRRTDTLWKAFGKAAVLNEAISDLRLVLLTTDAPEPGSAGHRALEILRGPGKPVFDLIRILDPTDQERLSAFAAGRPDV